MIIKNMENDVKNLRENLTGFADGVLRCLPERSREMVAKRFGLRNNREKTLKEVGEDYGISRERVRQIEKAALGKLKKIESNRSAVNVFGCLRRIIVKRGGVIGERNLMKIILGKENNYPVKGALFLALKLDKEMERIKEDSYFARRWVCDVPLEVSLVPFDKEGNLKEGNLERQVGFVNYLLEFFNSAKRIINSEEMMDLFKNKSSLNLPGNSEREILLSYLEPSKLIEQNYFGQWGLKSWPEIKPRSIKDKIYMALTKEKRPLHFVEIAETINEICQDKKLAKPQTVHNELIKDERCVLIGRGIYALREWGYQEGIVKEVIAEVLKKKNRAMNKDEIVEEVLEKRMIKKNTVIVNLKNHECFVRMDGGRYKLES